MSAPASEAAGPASAADEKRRRMRMRNIAIGVVLGGLAAFFYAVTLVKLMGGGA